MSSFILLGSLMEIVFIYLSTYSIASKSEYAYYYIRKSISPDLCDTHWQTITVHVDTFRIIRVVVVP
jgi:hypothetical protein